MEERQGDIRVPLIACVLCVFVTAGGVFLGIYVFYPSEAEPWFLAVAFLMIGSPWVFWVVTYFYTCIKRCLAGKNPENRQMSMRSSGSISTDKSENSNNDEKSPPPPPLP